MTALEYKIIIRHTESQIPGCLTGLPPTDFNRALHASAFVMPFGCIYNVVCVILVLRNTVPRLFHEYSCVGSLAGILDFFTSTRKLGLWLASKTFSRVLACGVSGWHL